MRLACFLLVGACCLAGCHKESEGSGTKDAGKQSGSEGSGESKQQLDPGTVKIERQNQSKAGISIAAVEVRTMPRVLTVTGQVAMNDQQTSHIGALASGRVTAVYVTPGTPVRRGSLLAQYHSDSVHETVSSLIQAFAAVERQRSAVTFAQQADDRYTHLYAIQAGSLEEKQHASQMVAQARQDLTDAQATVHAEREHLSELLQVEPESLTPTNLYDRELLPIRSPRNGVVISRNVTVGQVVDTGFEAFTVSDLSSIWMMAAVNEKDLSLVHNGARADVITQGYPETVFPGRVAMVGDTLAPETRTIPVRIAVPNPGTRLRPGMFGTAQINGPTTRTALFIPEEALQDVNGNQVVFTTQDGSIFKAQVVKLGTRSAGQAEVIEGLKPGDHLVVQGAFMVKGELLKNSVGDS